MAPSAPLPCPPPAAPLNAFLEGDGAVHPSNGHESSSPPEGSPPPETVPLVAPSPPKLPGKSNLKRHSMFGSPQLQRPTHQLPSRHTQSFSGRIDLGIGDPTAKAAGGRDASPPSPPSPARPGADKARGKLSPGNGAPGLAVSGVDFVEYKRKDSRVKWTDNHGQDLAEVWEFEPSDTGDSDDESDSDSSQACTCVIQ